VKALGFPWTDVPDAENAAAFYIKGANALHASGDVGTPWREYDYVQKNPWDPALTGLAKKLDASRAALNYYRQGSTKKLCQLPFNKSPILAGMLLPDLGQARNACRLLAAEARRFESQKKFTEAVDTYLAILRIGSHHAKYGRTLIDHLVGIAGMSIGLNGAFYGVCRHTYPPAELKRFLAELDKLADVMPDYARAMQSERAFGLGCIDDLMRLGSGGAQLLQAMNVNAPVVPGSPLTVRITRIVLPDRTIKADMGRFYDRHIAAAKQPAYSEAARRDYAKDCKPWNVLAQMLLPALGRARDEGEKVRARYHALRVVLALKLYRAREGAYPDQLTWLVAERLLPKIPPDPFSGKPLRYKLLQGKFLVYSVGPNFTDDGGSVEAPDRETGDIGYSSKLPPVTGYKQKGGAR